MDPNEQPSEEPTVEERLEELEAQVVAYKRLGLVAFLLLLAAVGVLKYQAVEATRRFATRELVLLDDAGKQRGTLTVAEAGPTLDLYGQDGEPRLALAAGDDGSALTFHAPNGKPAARLDGTAKARGLAVFDAAGERRLELGVEEEAPHLRLYDDAGSKRTALAVGGTGAGLVFMDGDGKKRAWLGERFGTSQLELYDARGKRPTLFDSPAAPRPAPEPAEQTVRAQRLELVDRAGKVRAEMGIQANGEMGLFLYRKEGREEGKRAAALSVGPDSSVLLACFEKSPDGDARCRAHFGLSRQGSPFLMLHSERSQPRAWLEVDPDGAPHLSLFAKDGKRIWKAP